MFKPWGVLHIIVIWLQLQNVDSMMSKRETIISLVFYQTEPSVLEGDLIINFSLLLM